MDIKNINNIIFMGGYPNIIAKNITNEHTISVFYRNYVNTYLQKDIFQLLKIKDAVKFLDWSLFVDGTTQYLFAENDIHNLLRLPDNNPFWQFPHQLRSNIVDFLIYAHNALPPQESSGLLDRFRSRGFLNIILFRAIESANSQPIDKLSVYNYRLTGNDYYRDNLTYSSMNICRSFKDVEKLGYMGHN